MNVPQLRFDGFDGDWEETTLKKVIKSMVSGVSVNSTDKPARDGKIGVLKTSSISKGRFFPFENKEILDTDIKRAKLNPTKETILISRMNTPKLVGEIGYVEQNHPHLFLPDRLWMATTVVSVNSKWLAYLLVTDKYNSKILNLATGTSNSMKNISKEQFLSLNIWVPDINEQDKVASFLTILDRKIEKQQEKIEKLEQFKKGMMQKIFSQELRFKDEDGGEFPEWETKSLMELGEFKRSYSFSRSYEGEGKYFHIHYGDIHTKLRSIIDTDTELPNINVNGDLEELEAGDILFADASEDYKDLGKAVVIISNENKKIVAGLHTHRFRPSSLINPVYLMYFTKTDYYSSFIRMYGTGVSVLGISKTNLGIIDVPIPSIKEQEKIADYLLSIEKKIKKEKEKLLVLEEQKKGFMQGMFV